MKKLQLLSLDLILLRPCIRAREELRKYREKCLKIQNNFVEDGCFLSALNQSSFSSDELIPVMSSCPSDLRFF